MIIGVPKEIKQDERRVGLIPASVRSLVNSGHKVLLENNSGVGVGCKNEAYQEAGAEIIATAQEIFARSDLIVKVKEPQPIEYALLQQGQILFTYLHLAANKSLTDALIQSGCSAIAYETVTDSIGNLPLLAPMSQIAGKMSVQLGAHCLESTQGGPGLLLSGVPGVEPVNVLIIGGGVAGSNAAKIAVGMGAKVTIIDKSIKQLNLLDNQFAGRITTLYAAEDYLLESLKQADLVIAAALVPGAKAPTVVSRADLISMKEGAVVVDIAIDQGGCFETSKVTTHQDPTYTIEGVTHYCVANIPGACARTACYALSHSTSPYIHYLADNGFDRAIKNSEHLANGLNVHHGKIVHAAVAAAHN